MKRCYKRKRSSNDTHLKCTGVLELVECKENPIRTHPRIYLRGPKFTFGRTLKSTIYLDSSQISRNHCVMVYDKKKWNIKDVSMNGTAVNGKKLTKNELVILKNLDVISFVRGSSILKYTYFEDQNRPSQSKVDLFKSVPSISSSPNSNHNNDTVEIGKSLSQKPVTLFSEWNEEGKSNASPHKNLELQTNNYIQQSPVIRKEKSIPSDSTKIQPLTEILIEDLLKRRRKRKQEEEEDPVIICKIPKLVYSQDEQSDVDSISNKDDTEFRQQSNSDSEVVTQNKKVLNVTDLKGRLRKQNNILGQSAISISKRKVKPIKEPNENDRISHKKPITAQLGKAFYQNRFFLPPLLFGKNENQVKQELDKVSHDKPTSLSGKLHLEKEKDRVLNPAKTVDPNAVDNVLKNQERINEIWLNTLNKRLEVLKKEREEKEREEKRKSEMKLQQQQMNENGPRRSNRVSKPPERFGCFKDPLQSILRGTDSRTLQSRSEKKKEQRHEALEISNPSFRAKVQRLKLDKGIEANSQPDTFLWERKDWSQRRRHARLEFSRRSALSTANTIKKYLDHLTD